MNRLNKMYLIKRYRKEDRIAKKLIEMGLTPGEVVVFEKVAPFGDPYIVKVRNYQLAIRKSDLRNMILVECKG